MCGQFGEFGVKRKVKQVMYDQVDITSKDLSGLQNRFAEAGYVVIHQLIADHKIERLLSELEQFKQQALYYYSQSIHDWITPELDDEGFLIESMENFTQLYWAKGLAEAGNHILLSEEIHQVLQSLQGNQAFALWQNMLFDRSTGTVDHQDSYYLDTHPKGQLIGAWVALEDIHEESGAFHVYPKSHQSINPDVFESVRHQDLIDSFSELTQHITKKPLLLKKGDVIFWDSRLIHGAQSQINPRYSRKSITAHYFPLGVERIFSRKHREDQEPIKYIRPLEVDRKHIRFIDQHPIAVGYSAWEQCKYNAKGYWARLMKLFNKSASYRQFDMKRRSYSK